MGPMGRGLRDLRVSLRISFKDSFLSGARILKGTLVPELERPQTKAGKRVLLRNLEYPLKGTPRNP